VLPETALSSSDAKLERAYALGADLGVNYRTCPEWETRVRELTDGQGVDLVIENAATLRQSVQATRYGGTVAVIGMLAVLVPGGSRPNPENSRRGRFRYRHKRLRMVESRCHTFFLHHGGVCVDH